MAYYILQNDFNNRGTPGNMEGISAFFKGLDQKKRNDAIQKAISEGGYEAKYKQDKSGNFEAEYAKPAPKDKNSVSAFKQALAGYRPMEDVFSKEAIDQAAPRSLGAAAGGPGGVTIVAPSPLPGRARRSP